MPCVDVSDFGAIGDGVTDDTWAFSAAMAYLCDAGGVVTYGARHRVCDITVPKNIEIRGPGPANGVSGTNALTPFDDRPAILLDGCITLTTNCRIRNATILRSSVSLPAADASCYSGTAIVTTQDDCIVEDCTIIGFALCVSAIRSQRFRLVNLALDGNKGIDTATIADTSIIDKVHCWPYGTIKAYYDAVIVGGGTHAANAYRLHRSGFGVRIGTQSDNLIIDKTLTYGYFVGFDLTNASACSIGGIWADNTGKYVNSTGIKFGAGADRIQAESITAFGFANNVLFQMNGNATCAIDKLHANSGTSQNVQFLGGSIHIGHLDSRNSAGAALLIGTNASRAHIGTLVDYNNAYPQPIILGVPNVTPEDIHIGRLQSDKPPGSHRFGANAVAYLQIPNAEPLALHVNRDHFRIVGSGPFSNISGGYAGRCITLIFETNATIAAGGNTDLAVNLGVGSGAMVRFIYDSFTSKWRRI